MTPETVALLLTLLDSVSLSGRDPELVTKAERVALARDELVALQEVEPA